MKIRIGCYQNTFVALITGVAIGMLLMQIPNISFIAKLIETETICSNSIDDDDDLLIDCSDPDCEYDPACLPMPEMICDNEIDDDSDGNTDCDDEDCSIDPSCYAEEFICNNSIDDDGDLLIDCSDPDCEFDPACY